MLMVLLGRTLGAGSGTTVFAINGSESSTQTPTPSLRGITILSNKIYHRAPLVALQSRVPSAVRRPYFLYVKLRT
jgi:hypothetical protein